MTKRPPTLFTIPAEEWRQMQEDVTRIFTLHRDIQRSLTGLKQNLQRHYGALDRRMTALEQRGQRPPARATRQARKEG